MSAPDDTAGRGPRPALTLVVPAYNEGDRLVEGVGRLSEAVRDGAVDPSSTEVVVVDDGSTDGTGPRAATLFGAVLPTRVHALASNRGKGAAVRAGVTLSTGDVVAFIDADMAIDPHQLPALVAALGEADLAIGSRAVGAGGVDYGDVRRTLEARAFNRLVTLITGLAIRDTQCGCKAFAAPVARLLFAATAIDRFAFDMEVLGTARRLGLRIAEVPVAWDNVPGSRIRPLADPLSMCRDLVASRLGRRRPPPLPAAVVPGAPDPADVAAALAAAGGPPLPVLTLGGGRTAVLLGLLPPGRAEAARDVLAAAFGTPPARIQLAASDLVPLAPLRLGVAPGARHGGAGPA